MTKYHITPTHRERTFDEDELIVSKTDPKGHITYANRVFLRVAGYRESEVLGKPHSIIRHPDMPRCIFKLLWDTVQSGHEIFAYVKNLAKDGAFYWVFAHVTPSFGENGTITGYHSNRRFPRPQAVAAIAPVYNQLLEEESRFENRKEGMLAAERMLRCLLDERGIAYDEFVFSL